MGVDLACYRAAIGLFNAFRFSSSRVNFDILGEISGLIWSILSTLICLAGNACLKLFIACVIPLLVLIFIVLNLSPGVCARYPILYDFTSFIAMLYQYVILTKIFSIKLASYISIKLSKQFQSL